MKENDEKPDIENQLKNEDKQQSAPSAEPAQAANAEEQKQSWGQRNPGLMGFGKMLFSIPFGFMVANPVSLVALAAWGGGFIVGGRLMRAFGWYIKSETLMENGARISDAGVKIALSPIYAVSAALEGAYSAFISGEDISLKDGLIGGINNATDWISGMNSVKAEKEALKQAAKKQAANSNKGALQQDEAEIRADERKKVMEEMKGKNSQQSQNNNNAPQTGQGQQNSSPAPGTSYSSQAPLPHQQVVEAPGHHHQASANNMYPQGGGSGYSSQMPMQQFSPQNYSNYNDYSVHPMETVHSAGNLQEAQNNYMQFVNAHTNNQFKQSDVEVQSNGYKVTWCHPENKSQQVICYYDKQGRCVKAESVNGSNASAILPPIYTSKNNKGFKVQQLNNGNIEDFVPTKEQQQRSSMQNTLEQHQQGAGSNIPPVSPRSSATVNSNVTRG